MQLNEFLIGVSTTVTGGAILTILIFLIKERICPIPDLSGLWYLKQTTETSAYNPYKGVSLKYLLVLHCDGKKIEGTAEKLYEESITSEESRSYFGKNRTRATISGSIQKRYFEKDLIYLHVIEQGHGREYTTFYKLELQRSTGGIGSFSTTAADQTGSVLWQRTIL
jgi:hypothetical protein